MTRLQGLGRWIEHLVKIAVEEVGPFFYQAGCPGEGRPMDKEPQRLMEPRVGCDAIERLLFSLGVLEVRQTFEVGSQVVAAQCLVEERQPQRLGFITPLERIQGGDPSVRPPLLKYASPSIVWWRAIENGQRFGGTTGRDEADGDLTGKDRVGGVSVVLRVDKGIHIAEGVRDSLKRQSDAGETMVITDGWIVDWP